MSTNQPKEQAEEVKLSPRQRKRLESAPGFEKVRAVLDPTKAKESILASFSKFLTEHKILEILPIHAKVLSIDLNISIKTGLAAMCEQRSSQCVVWDGLRSEFKGTLMLRNFLEVLFNNETDAKEQEAKSTDHEIFDEAAESEPENYVHIIGEMDKHILKNSVYTIFDIATKVTHRIVKMNYDRTLKDIWDVMVEDNLKMAALESQVIPDEDFCLDPATAPNRSSYGGVKIPKFIQGFITHHDFLEYFLENYEGEVQDFEVKIKDLKLYYATDRGKQDDGNSIQVVLQNEKLFVVLNKMLDYRISMAPVVDNMTNKKTIGLFFLKDVFWLLRSSKFEFLDKEVLCLLKTIYQEAQEIDSGASEEVEEELESEGEWFEEIDEAAKQFLEDLEEDETSKAHTSSKRISSYNYEPRSEDFVSLSEVKKGKSKDTLEPAEGIIGDLPKSRQESETSDPKINKLESFKSEIKPDVFAIKKTNSGNDEFVMRKRKTNDPDTRPKRKHRNSINSFTPEFQNKKMLNKVKEIYGITRIALFHRDNTFKECLEKIVCVPENRLIELDASMKVVGIMTLSDIISFFSNK